MLFVNSINIVHGSKKERWKHQTCTFKLNIRENKILLSTSGNGVVVAPSMMICRQTAERPRAGLYLFPNDRFSIASTGAIMTNFR